MALQERLQHLPALRREAQALARAGLLGMVERLGRAARMVVLAMFQDWADRTHLGSEL